MAQIFRHTRFSVFFCVLASCGPVPVYYQDGTNQTRINSDTISCDVQALKEAPVALETRQHPPTFYPGYRQCNGGTCWTRPGYWIEGASYTVDLNKGLRQRVAQNCMVQKGYQRLDLPRCSQDDIAALSNQENSGGLTAASCALRQKDGSTIILPPL